MKAIVVAALLVALVPAVAAPQAAATGATQGAAPGSSAGGGKKATGTSKRVNPSSDAARTELARARFRRGAQLYREARYREAIAEFQAAYRIKPSGILHFNIGQAQEKLGETSAALASYDAYLREVPDAPNRETVQRAIENLKPRLGGVPGAAAGTEAARTGAASPPGASAVPPAAGLAGATPSGAAPVPSSPPAAPAAPPAGAAAASAAGPAGTAPAGSAPLAPSPAVLPQEATRPVPAPRPVERKSWMAPIILGGVAVVAAGAGAIMGVQARNAQDQLLAGVADRAQADALVKKANNAATTANVLYGVAGAAALAGGAVVVFGGYF